MITDNRGANLIPGKQRLSPCVERENGISLKWELRVRRRILDDQRLIRINPFLRPNVFHPAFPVGPQKIKPEAV